MSSLAFALLPNPDFRKRVSTCVSHVGLSRVARRVAEWIGAAHPLLKLKNVFCTPRLRYCEDEQYESIYGGAVSRLLAYARENRSM
jgi:phosphoglycerate dehydrogenase-like enzyme